MYNSLIHNFVTKKDWIMRSSFKVLFYVNASKEKNGVVPIMGRVTINGSVAQFSCKRTIPKELWDVKGNRAKGKSKEAREINLALDNIKAQIIKHYQRLSDREAYVTAEMVRNAYQGIGTEYETLLGAFDKDNATFKKRVGTDAATALASGVGSLFGSGKMKSLERKNEDLKDEIAIRDETIEQLQSNIKRMQVEHQKQIQEVKQLYEAENRKQSEYIDRILRYFPYVEKLMPMIKYLSERMGFNDNLIKALCTFKEIPVKGKLYSTMFNQSFSADGAVCSLKEDKEGLFDLRIDGVSHHSWFRRKKDEFMQSLGMPTRKQNKGIQL